jgi:hypothetical protein
VEICGLYQTTMEQSEKDQIFIKEPLLRYFVDRRYSKHRRGVLLVLVFVIFLFIGTGIEKNEVRKMLPLYAGLTIAVLGPIFLNLFVLIPKFLFKRRYLLYFFLSNLCIVACYLILLAFIFLWWPATDIQLQTVPKESFLFGGVFYVFVISIFCAATAAGKLFQKQIRDSYKIMQLENTLIHTELDLLKTNISPHFLFNMLNNSEVLIQTDPLKARQILRKLSEFLRYQLYDSRRQTVLLSADIRFLEHFLSLETIRRDYFQFDIYESGTERQVEVSPLLFIPFVENALKHNIESGPGAYVNLSFVLEGQILTFTCVNPVAREIPAKKNAGGFGLPNVQRRLGLLYPEKYNLNMVEKNGVFSVTLELIL